MTHSASNKPIRVAVGGFLCVTSTHAYCFNRLVEEKLRDFFVTIY